MFQQQEGGPKKINSNDSLPVVLDVIQRHSKSSVFRQLQCRGIWDSILKLLVLSGPFEIFRNDGDDNGEEKSRPNRTGRSH